MDYYIIKPGESNGTWRVLKFTQHRDRYPVAEGIVTEAYDGSFSSDDYGFQSHQNEKANKRIRVVKEHIRLGCPSMVTYWIENGKIHHHRMILNSLFSR